jgi:sulfonate transport system ATP-binding protein
MDSTKNGSFVQVRNMAKRYGSQEVLNKINLTIKPGEFIAVVGRSGCGKSTLLRLVAGLEQASEGGIYLDGAQLGGIHPETRVLFQDARLLPWKKVLANVRIGVRGGGKEAAADALCAVGLETRADDWPAVLSGGQKQRIALARALAGAPHLLLLDEPLGALDALTRIEMQQLIERLWLEQGFSVILVTHDVGEAVALADRVLLIENGGITLDIPITLARPREKHSGFAYFEKLILDRVLGKKTSAGNGSQTADRREYSFSV